MTLHSFSSLRYLRPSSFVREEEGERGPDSSPVRYSPQSRSKRLSKRRTPDLFDEDLPPSSPELARGAPSPSARLSYKRHRSMSLDAGVTPSRQRPAARRRGEEDEVYEYDSWETGLDKTPDISALMVDQGHGKRTSSLHCANC
jgi:hypothetical protein